MKTLIGGAVAAALGLIGLAIWWGQFLMVLAGIIPIMLLLGGGLAIYLGFDELKDTWKKDDTVSMPAGPDPDPSPDPDPGPDPDPSRSQTHPGPVFPTTSPPSPAKSNDGQRPHDAAGKPRRDLVRISFSFPGRSPCPGGSRCTASVKARAVFSCPDRASLVRTTTSDS